MQNICESEGLKTTTDSQLVSLAQQGSERAFAELMRRHSNSMMQVAVGILHDTQEAEDELQNAWWKAWQHIDGFAGDSRFTTWLTRIVMNQCLMRLRQTRRARFLYMDAPAPGEERVTFELRDAGATPEEALGRREVRDLMRREIARIPPLLRHALVLREVNQLPMPEVAGQLGISIAAAKSRLLRARHELRHRLEKYCGQMGAATLTA
ncbi:MAG: sigma-70 family RNA polymerase sigma factor [Candidatus Solibacter sp.]|nr:sigma-70 family RNA polymerase sigma factor [Candidatus Solibacter sp.]